jgi:hypothetical protein
MVPSALGLRALAVLIAVHVLIGFAARESDWASTIYAVVSLVAAAVVVLRTPRPEFVVAAVGYVAGAEVLWRMTDARIFWETGKYAIAGLLMVALIRFWPGWSNAILPALYLVLLVPGAVVAIEHFGLADARGPLSFNLSGPLVIAMSVLFCSQLRVSLDVLRLVLWPVVFPIVAMATAVLIGIVEAGPIHFNGESNLATSGGYGPNQVSSVLGFGVLVCLIEAATERDRRLRLVEIGLATWLLAHAIFTFARGGVANVVVAVLLALLTSLRRLRNAGRGVLMVIVAFAVLSLVILPLLNSLSGGGLLNRYNSVSVTGRDSLVRNDLEIFGRAPVLGAGVGVSPTMRHPAAIRGDAAETEFTRLLADHGLFGIAALCVLVAMVVIAFRRARRGVGRALVAAFVGWSFTEMAHSATRIALAGYALGLAVAAAGLVTGDTEPTGPTETATVAAP